MLEDLHIFNLWENASYYNRWHFKIALLCIKFNWLCGKRYKIFQWFLSVQFSGIKHSQCYLGPKPPIIPDRTSAPINSGLLSVSMHLPPPGTSRQWNHPAFALVSLVIKRVSRFTHGAAHQYLIPFLAAVFHWRDHLICLLMDMWAVPTNSDSEHPCRAKCPSPCFQFF